MAGSTAGGEATDAAADLEATRTKTPTSERRMARRTVNMSKQEGFDVRVSRTEQRKPLIQNLLIERRQGRHDHGTCTPADRDAKSNRSTRARSTSSASTASRNLRNLRSLGARIVFIFIFSQCTQKSMFGPRILALSHRIGASFLGVAAPLRAAAPQITAHQRSSLATAATAAPHEKVNAKLNANAAPRLSRPRTERSLLIPKPRKTRTTSPLPLKAKSEVKSEASANIANALAVRDLIASRMAPRMNDPLFVAAVEKWRTRLGPLKFRTFLKVSVIVRLLDPAFDESLTRWHDRLGSRIGTFLSDSVAVRLGDPTFELALEKWHGKLGTRFPTFLSDSVATRLCDPLFVKALERWMRVLGEANTVILLSDGVASRLVNPEFDAALTMWHARLGPLVVRFMNNCVASRLLEPAFVAITEKWFVLLGAPLFVQFICGSVAARLHDREFVHALERWHTRLGSEQFVVIMTGCVAKRLTDPAFAARLERWYELTGDRFKRMLCTGISARLNRLDAFLPFYVANPNWTSRMTAELVKSIPLDGGPVDPAVWEAILARRKEHTLMYRRAARLAAAASSNSTKTPRAPL
jgi:hypothetical protein